MRLSRRAVRTAAPPRHPSATRVVGFTGVASLLLVGAAVVLAPTASASTTNSTSYTFTAHATSQVGDSAEFRPSAAVTPADRPGAPTGVSAVAGDGQVSVSFTAPASDGGSPITSYTATSSPGGRTASCPGSPCVVSGLTNGTSYTFTVHATNATGNSAESTASAAVIPADRPSAPTGVSATAGNQQVSVSFSAPASDGGSPITSYTVTSSPGGLTATCPGSPCVVSGLTNATSYTFTVHATNATGNGAESTASAAVTPTGAPGAPTGVSAVAGDEQASVSFTAPMDDGGSPITSYTVTSSPGGLTATCPGSPCVVTGLTNGTSYTFTVHATSRVGDSADSSPTAAVTPTGPPGAAPTDVSATAGNGQVSVSFTAPMDDGGSPITSYTVTSAPGGLTATCPGYRCVVTGLTNGTSYTFTVHATNANGDSAESASSTAVTPTSRPGAPTGASATVGDEQASVSFTAPMDDGGSPVTSYVVTSSPGGLTATCPGSPCVVTGLTNGTSYTFTVHAVNAQGSGAESAATTAVTPVGAPGAPEVSVVAGNGSVTVSFAAPFDGGSAITGYQYSLDAGTTWLTLNTTTTSGRVRGVITGLRNGTGYRITVRAVNANDPGPASAAASATPLAPRPPSPAPKPDPTPAPKPRPTAGWYKDPFSHRQRDRLASVPKDPARSRGKARYTQAMYRTHDGTLAVPASKVRSHQLRKGQGVQLAGLFRFDSSRLSKHGRHDLAMLARSLKSVRSITCEGYADYAGLRGHEQRLAKARAVTVCRVLAKLTSKVATHAVGYGSARPVVIGGSAKSRTANRRVDLLVRR